jgi:hypothetical protein
LYNGFVALSNEVIVFHNDQSPLVNA